MLIHKKLIEALLRWPKELRLLLSYLRTKGHVRAPALASEIPNRDILYSILLVLLTALPAFLVARLTSPDSIQMLNRFFAAPMNTVISGFLISIFLFFGTHFLKKPQSFPFAYHLMLTILTVNPILELLHFFKGGEIVRLLIYGVLVSKVSSKAYGIPFQNTFVFYGAVYFMFALLQLKTFAPTG